MFISGMGVQTKWPLTTWGLGHGGIVPKIKHARCMEHVPRLQATKDILFATLSLSQNSYCYHVFTDDLFGCQIRSYEKHGLNL
jgi:hypothetical protein